MKSGGRIPWNATPICETYKISCLIGKTPFERRIGVPFNGPVIPFGAMVEYHPISAKDLSRLRQFGTKVLPWIFLGYVLYGGNLERRHIGRRHWDGRIWNSRLETQCKGSVSASGWWKFFPIADGTVKLSGGDQVLRTSTLIRDNPDRGEEQWNLLGESDGSSPTPFQDSSPDDGEARNDCWSISGTTFAVITLNRESNCTCREKNHSQFHYDTST